MSREVVEIVTTVATEQQAAEVGRTLVRERLVACANTVPCRSTYWWEGALHEEGELQVTLKTLATRAAAAERRLREIHPYRTPAILRVDVAANPEYAAWVASCVGETQTDAPGGAS